MLLRSTIDIESNHDPDAYRGPTAFTYVLLHADDDACRLTAVLFESAHGACVEGFVPARLWHPDHRLNRRGGIAGGVVVRIGVVALAGVTLPTF